MTGIGSDEAKAIEREIAKVEAATGAQVVAAVVPRADDYPEAPWRAFALAAALAALAAFVLDVLRPEWTTRGALLAQALVILACGALAAIAARALPAFRRLFVSAPRAQAEVRQCAEVMFLTRELFATPQRTAILILVAQMERRVVVVPDVAYRGRIATDEWRAVVDAMTPRLREDRVSEAFTVGLGRLQSLLLDKGFRAGDGANLLADALVREPAP